MTCSSSCTSNDLSTKKTPKGNWTNLGGNDELVADAALLLPFADEFLGRLFLTVDINIILKASQRASLVISGVNEVPAVVEVGIQHFEAGRLIH